MNIILDAMGGDNAPLETVKGAIEARAEVGCRITLVGDRNAIERAASEAGMSLGDIDIIHTDVVLTMEDDPISVVRSKKDCSMAVGLRELKNGGDAFVSAGNTGALHAGSSLIVRPIKGVQRSAIATILPFKKPMMLLDSGANTNVTPEYLYQWALMGSIYMNKLFGIDSPTVGLLNNGTEEHKGTEIEVATHKLLSDTELVNFVGNVEGTAVPMSPCDVIVTDGFTGNITLKLVEGMGKFMFGLLRELFTANAVSKLSYLAVKGNVMNIKNSLDASEYGGAPLLGLTKPVIKAHGSSDARAIKNAVKQAVKFVETDVISAIAESMQMIKPEDRA